jgi:hypothetical protein
MPKMGKEKKYYLRNPSYLSSSLFVFSTLLSSPFFHMNAEKCFKPVNSDGNAHWLIYPRLCKISWHRKKMRLRESKRKRKTMKRQRDEEKKRRKDEKTKRRRDKETKKKANR